MVLKEFESIQLQEDWENTYISNAKSEQDVPKCWKCY